MSRRAPAHVADERTFGERAADAVAAGMGSWRFIISQTMLVLGWIAYNGFVAVRWFTTGEFDPFPFVLLNLAFSTQAAYATPVLLMSQERQSRIDRAHAEISFGHTDEILTLNKEQMGRFEAIERRGVEQHSEILAGLHVIAEALGV